MKSLNEIGWGNEVVVKKIGSKGALRRRMIDLGITEGAKVKVIKSAPLGDPIEICIHGYKLSIRKSDAKEIKVFENDREIEDFKLRLKEPSFINEYLNIPILNSDLKSKKAYKAALVGNPNCGKTTLFNHLTGSYQYVGNWPGVTVERKEGRIKNLGDKIDLVDLPGVYSLSPYSPEEIVTRNYILNEIPDIIINVVDATNLERNLYLTTQLLELDCKIILVINMTDLLRSKGKEIDAKDLEKKLGVPVVCISAGKGKGIEKLLETLSLLIKKKNIVRHMKKIYSNKLEEAIEKIDKILNPKAIYSYNSRFKAVKAFEGDKLILKSYTLTSQQIKYIEEVRGYISKLYDKEKDTIIPDERYKYIYRICKTSVRELGRKSNISFSEKIDKFVTGKYTAFPCFLTFIILIFYFSFGPIGVALKDLSEQFLNNQMAYTIGRILNYIGVSEWIKSLFLDAIIRGVGAVISFLPQILLLFSMLSILEDCGYMARAAFIMDRPMRKIGLSGKAFVPLIMGFGCSVPAVMGTKILESKKDKHLTIFLIPFMSCSAKMPLYLLFASTFFPNSQALIIFSLYIFGVLCACLTAYIFKDTIFFKGEESPFLMEMPDYKLPSFKNIRLNVWDKAKDFVERAGTIILVATVFIWFLQYFDITFKHVADNSQSILAQIGKLISPLFRVCGFDDWRVSVSLLTGIMAKESIVSTLSVLYGAKESLAQTFNWINGLSFLIFVLLYVPCVAAVSAIYKEFEDKKLAILSVFYQVFIAYVISGLVYQLITLFYNFIS